MKQDTQSHVRQLAVPRRGRLRDPAHYCVFHVEHLVRGQSSGCPLSLPVGILFHVKRNMHHCSLARHLSVVDEWGSMDGFT